MDNIKGMKRTHYCGDLRSSNINEEVVLMGWVQKKRNLGGLVFVDLRDKGGICQIVFDTDVDKEAFEKAEKLGSEYVIAVRGKVSERQSKNPNMETGDVEIFAHELRILNESQTPPIYVKDGDDASEALRLKYRYLDLRKPSMQKNFFLRHKVTNTVRKYLTGKDFCEIETPFLINPTPEGARDYLVPSRVNQGKFYALPQSPQLFKQILMVAGMDKYFQIVKCFRDEDLRADRQPEFTQIDCEMSFVEAEDVITMIEGLIKEIFQEVMGIEISLPIKQMKYDEAMNKYGSDKPDLRFGFEFVDVSELVKDSGFKVFADATQPGKSVRGININGQADGFTRKQITQLEEHAKTYRAKGLAWMKVTDEGVTSPIAKFFNDEELNAILEKMNAKSGDLLLFVADKNSVVYDALGQVRLEVANRLGLLDKDKFELVWITEFPLFEQDEETGHYSAAHHPFTSPLDEDIDRLHIEDKSSLRAKAYDIVLNGYEIGGGSVRISDPVVQKKMFDVLGLDDATVDQRFGYLMEAFKYGVPPHAGLAFGLDRLVMILAKVDSIREVIAFPKNQNAICPLTNAPNIAEQEQLDELGLALNLK
ncbi:MAG: aspartate--tRNA ligase [Clostridioides sp.]|jgi:aspartyl-tRNA synthetase|nr:aspartate--tRNA ligase [Clostridioides sp.]